MAKMETVVKGRVDVVSVGQGRQERFGIMPE